MKYTIVKTLVLEFEIEAESAQEAYDACLDADDSTFAVRDCDYTVFDATSQLPTEEEYE